jgi:hypothetical protein
MIIAITPSGSLEFREKDDFKGFKIAVEKSGATDAEIAAALKGVATMDGSGHAWASLAALKNWGGKPQPADWIASFDAMIEKVKKYGFVSDDGASVRGHFERA